MFEIRKGLPRGMRLFGSVLASLLVVVLLVSACMPAAPPAPLPAPAPEPAPMPVPAPEPELAPAPAPTPAEEALVLPEAAAPVLMITAPLQGATLMAGDIEVSVSVENFKLVALGAANVEGEGHLHFYMDVDVPTTLGRPAVTAAGTYKATAETSVIWESVSAGMHTFSVQLVNNDHTPLSSAVIAEVMVTVAGEQAPLPETVPEPTPSYPYSY